MAKAWKVTRQTVMSGGAQIEYQTDDGVTHSIFVGAGEYSPAGVRQAITAQQATHEAIANMTSEG